MNKINEEKEGRTSARISLSTAEVLRQQRVRLAVLAGRELSNDDVIRAMHAVFVRQPETVIAKTVQS
jgi:hypothetical protein